MNLESPKVTVQKSAQDLFTLLTDVKNFEQLMPENIAKFEVIGEDAFIFGLKGMPEIKLKMKDYLRWEARACSQQILKKNLKKKKLI